jgi:hypothetical protein
MTVACAGLASTIFGFGAKPLQRNIPEVSFGGISGLLEANSSA